MRFAMLFSFVALAITRADLHAQDNSKTFAAHFCKYTLPGNDWSWVASADPETLFLARNAEGIQVGLSVRRVPPETMINDKFVADAKAEFENSKDFKCLNAKIISFQNLNCCDVQLLFKGKMHVARRILFANERAYMVQITGRGTPVSERPDYESLMNGFELTSNTQPVTVYVTETDFERLSKHLGAIGVIGMIIAGAMFVIKSRSKSKKLPPV